MSKAKIENKAEVKEVEVIKLSPTCEKIRCDLLVKTKTFFATDAKYSEQKKAFLAFMLEVAKRFKASKLPKKQYCEVITATMLEAGFNRMRASRLIRQAGIIQRNTNAKAFSAKSTAKFWAEKQISCEEIVEAMVLAWTPAEIIAALKAAGASVK